MIREQRCADELESRRPHEFSTVRRNVMGGGDGGRRGGASVRQVQSADRQTSGKDPSTMFSPQCQLAVVLTALASITVEGRQLTPLVCNSVNDLQEINEQTDFVYVTTRGKDCTFVLEGPPEAQLDIKVHSFSTDGSSKNACNNPPVRLFTYSKRNKLRQLEKVLCAEDDAVRTVTDTNTAIISSTLRYGSFFVRVRPLSSLTSRVIPDRTKPLTNNFVTQRRSDVTSRKRNELVRYTSDLADVSEIGGMFPPDLQSIDFFARNQFEIPPQFRAQPQGFVPSAYFPSIGKARPTDSYGAPVTAGPILWGPYPGIPAAQIDITSTPSPVEWVTGNQTFSGSDSTITFPGYTEYKTTTGGPPESTGKATEATSTFEPTRYTEPLTSTEPTTLTQTPPPSSVLPEKVTESEESLSSETPDVSTTISNSTTVTETEVLSTEQGKQEQGTQEQVKQEKVKQEQVKQEQVKLEQVKQEQVKQEQVKQEQVKQEQVKQVREGGSNHVGGFKPTIVKSYYFVGN